MPRKKQPPSTQAGRFRQWLTDARRNVRSWWPLAAIGVLVLVGLAWLTLVGVSEAIEYVNGQRRFQTTFDRIECNAGPRWIQPQRFLSEVRGLAQAPKRFSVLDEDVRRQIHSGLKRHVWVQSVESIEPIYPNRLKVELKYRYPVALIHVPGAWMIVDGHGVRLPLRDIPPDALGTCMKIEGIRTPPPEKAGARWDGPAVLAAVRLAEYLAPIASRTRLSHINMDNFGGRRDAREAEIVLVTIHNTKIAWGRPMDTDKPGELPPGEKYQRLLRVAEKESDYAHRDYDLRHWEDPTSRRRTSHVPDLIH